jgi:hypothetical protein
VVQYRTYQVPETRGDAGYGNVNFSIFFYIKEAIMALDFLVKDVIHKITAKFIHAYLPDAKKPYNLRAAFMPELDIHDVASKADVYNIETDPKVIEDGFTAACELILYLAADGYRIKTPLFNLNLRLPGEYEGNETRLAEGVYPAARLQASPLLRDYIRDKVQIEFIGKLDEDGLIAEATDEYSGQVDSTLTSGGILTIRGYGLKLESDAAHAEQAGLFFDNGTAPPVKADTIAVNEPKTIKAVVPDSLTQGEDYYLKIVTQSSVKGSKHVLKETREMRSEFKLKYVKKAAPAAGGETSGQA